MDWTEPITLIIQAAEMAALARWDAARAAFAAAGDTVIIDGTVATQGVASRGIFRVLGLAAFLTQINCGAPVEPIPAWMYTYMGTYTPRNADGVLMTDRFIYGATRGPTFSAIVSVGNPNATTTTVCPQSNAGYTYIVPHPANGGSGSTGKTYEQQLADSNITVRATVAGGTGDGQMTFAIGDYTFTTGWKTLITDPSSPNYGQSYYECTFNGTDISCGVGTFTLTASFSGATKTNGQVWSPSSGTCSIVVQE